MEIPDKVVHFFEKQNFVILSTMDAKEGIHCAAKGIAAVEKSGTLWVMDLYLRQTFKNVQRNPRVSVTAVDEHSFSGFTLQGQARIIPREEIPPYLLESWESRIVRRVSQRVVKGVQSKVQSSRHFEAGLPPQPQYVMAIDVENIIDLAPPASKHGRSFSV